MSDDLIELSNIATGLQAYDKMTFDQIYEGYKGILTKTKIFIPLLYEKGRQEGRTVEQIRSKIEGLGVEYRTAMRYTPDWAKQKQLHGKKVDKLSTQQVNRRLVVPEEPTLPPRPEVVQEAEIVKPKKQVYTLNSKTCKGWPCERDYIYEIELDEENKNVTKMYAVSD